jgi:hypothetical protein
MKTFPFKRFSVYLLGLIGAYELAHAIVVSLGLAWPSPWGGALVGLAYGLTFWRFLVKEHA